MNQLNNLVPRFRTRSKLGNIVDRVKHVIDQQGGGTAGTNVILDAAIASDNPSVNTNPNQVQTGSTINGVYIKSEANYVSGAAVPNLYFGVFKNPAGDLTPPLLNGVGGSDIRKYMIHQEMVMLTNDTTTDIPRVVFNGVVVIPRGYRRFGPGDKLQIILFSPVGGIVYNFCHQVHYKEFR